VSERRRGEVGAGGVWERAVPPPQKIFEIKMTCFGALWSMDFYT